MKKITLAQRALILHQTSPTFLLTLWFLVLLLAGTLLLWSPWSHQADGPEVSFLTALFTSTSAFCVTGLTIVDTPLAFSAFGQAVIAVLIELGGVGIMTFAALGFSMTRRRMSLASRAALNDALFQNNPVLELKRLFRDMLKAVLLIQLIGVALLYVAIVLHPAGHVNPLWSAVFHAVSAFCNAGFSIYENNLTQVAENYLFLLVIMVLVVLGGLGHGVLAELYQLRHIAYERRKRPHWLSANSHVVLVTTSILLVVGFIALAIVDQIFGTDVRIFDSLFHSVISRTAGFNSAPLEAIPLPSCLILCLLMFVGGSPGSCAGGIKTTSLAIWVARIRANLHHNTNVNTLGYSIPTHLLTKSRVIIALSCLWVIAGVFILTLSEPHAPLNALLFEQISALATVGLSMGLTPDLNWFSQIWIILSMIMGKFGPLTVALWMVAPVNASVRSPEGNILIG